MKLTRFTLLALGASLAMPMLASAQTTFYYEGPKTNSTTSGGIADGPYLMSLNSNGSNKFDIFCIDLGNNAPTVGAAYLARAVSFTEAVDATNYVPLQRVLGSAYKGSTGTYVNGASDQATYLRDLRAAAYLSSLFGATPNSNWDDIHGAIWSLFSSSSTAQIGSYATFRANAFTYVDAHTGDFADYRVIIDNNAYNPNYSYSYKQAFITVDGQVNGHSVVPEPSTYALFAAGLVGIAIARRRRNKVAAA